MGYDSSVLRTLTLRIVPTGPALPNAATLQGCPVCAHVAGDDCTHFKAASNPASKASCSTMSTR